MSIPKNILNAIEQRKSSEYYRGFHEGEDYYRVKNTAIMSRKKQVFVDSYGIVDNLYAANNKVPSGYVRFLVDQKVNYLLGNGMVTEEDLSVYTDYFEEGKDLNEVLTNVATTASSKGEAWLYAYKDAGKLKLIEIPPEQLTPVYDEYGKLDEMYRSYTTSSMEIVIVYTDELIVKYAREKGSSKPFKQVSAGGHFTEYSSYNGRVESTSNGSFGIVPFIKLSNDQYCDSDLSKVKPLVDVYDIIVSDFANNIEDMQEAFFTIKGYSGEAEHAMEFLKQLKETKYVPVGENGSVDTHQLEIPTEARKELLARLEVDIFLTGMGVNPNHIKGGSITNVVIKSMFTALELKTDAFETQMRNFISKLMKFIGDVEGMDTSFQYRFDRSLIINETEIAEVLTKLSDSKLSREAFLEILPYDIDKESELERFDTQLSDTE